MKRATRHLQTIRVGYGDKEERRYENVKRNLMIKLMLKCKKIKK